ncbi:hypothetical protein M0657_005050 [Pyricularia oryzae]|nr:hypothetical protein M9X92_009378 [Pyricularia oryzae]KAI7923585.1 hypothetical protein M0657_005050 [Pyricularia oryzae]
MVSTPRRAREDTVPYEVLLYTRGNDILLDVLRMEGDQRGTMSRVKNNQEPLCHDPRHKHKHPILWLDAIFIKQQDDNDKSKRTPSKSDIYRGTTMSPTRRHRSYYQNIADPTPHRPQTNVQWRNRPQLRDHGGDSGFHFEFTATSDELNQVLPRTSVHTASE